MRTFLAVALAVVFCGLSAAAPVAFMGAPIEDPGVCGVREAQMLSVSASDGSVVADEIGLDAQVAVPPGVFNVQHVCSCIPMVRNGVEKRLEVVDQLAPRLAQVEARAGFSYALRCPFGEAA